MAAETQIIISARDMASATFRRTQLAVENLKRTVFSLQTAFTGIGLSLLGNSLYDAGIQAERVDKSFTKVLGSTNKAAAELAFLREEAERVGFAFWDVAESTRNLYAAAKGTTMAGQGVRDLVSSVLNASADLNLSQQKVGLTFYALEQMMSKGTVTMEELKRQMGDNLPGSFQIAADAMGVTTGALLEMIKQGEVLSEDFLPKFSAEMNKRFSGDALPLAQKEANKLKTEMQDLRVELAREGFTDAVVDAMRMLREELSDPAVRHGLQAMVNGVTGIATALVGLVGPLGDIVKIVGKLPPELLTAAIGALAGSKFGPWGAAAGFAIGGSVSRELSVTDSERVNSQIESLKHAIETRQQRLAELNQGHNAQYAQQVEALRQKIAEDTEKLNGLYVKLGELTPADPWMRAATGAASGDEEDAPVTPPSGGMDEDAYKKWKKAITADAEDVAKRLRDVLEADQKTREEFREMRLAAALGETEYAILQVQRERDAYLAAGSDRVAVEVWAAEEISKLRVVQAEEQARQYEEALAASDSIADGIMLGQRRLQASMKSGAESTADAWVSMSQNMGQAFSTFFTDTVKGDLEDLADYIESFLLSIASAINNALGQQVSTSLLSSVGGFVADWWFGNISGQGGQDTLDNGGGSGGDTLGTVDKPAFADGGVSYGAQLAWVSEGRYAAEAHVPLPDGRSIPVDLGGEVGGGGETYNLNFTIQAMDGASVRRALVAERATIEGMIDQARSRKFKSRLLS